MGKLSRREESELLEEDQDVRLSTQYAGWDSEWGRRFEFSGLASQRLQTPHHQRTTH